MRRAIYVIICALLLGASLACWSAAYLGCRSVTAGSSTPGGPGKRSVYDASGCKDITTGCNDPVMQDNAPCAQPQVTGNGTCGSPGTGKEACELTNGPVYMTQIIHRTAMHACAISVCADGATCCATTSEAMGQCVPSATGATVNANTAGFRVAQDDGPC